MSIIRAPFLTFPSSTLCMDSLAWVWGGDKRGRWESSGKMTKDKPEERLCFSRGSEFSNKYNEDVSRGKSSGTI